MPGGLRTGLSRIRPTRQTSAGIWRVLPARSPAPGPGPIVEGPVGVGKRAAAPEDALPAERAEPLVKGWSRLANRATRGGGFVDGLTSFEKPGESKALDCRSFKAAKRIIVELRSHERPGEEAACQCAHWQTVVKQWPSRGRTDLRREAEGAGVADAADDAELVGGAHENRDVPHKLRAVLCKEGVK